MTQPHLSAELITAIIFGTLQLVVGIISVWQQRRLRHMNGRSISSGSTNSLTDIIMNSAINRRGGNFWDNDTATTVIHKAGPSASSRPLRGLGSSHQELRDNWGRKWVDRSFSVRSLCTCPIGVLDPCSFLTPGSPSAHATPALVARAQGGITLGLERAAHPQVLSRVAFETSSPSLIRRANCIDGSGLDQPPRRGVGLVLQQEMHQRRELWSSLALSTSL